MTAPLFLGIPILNRLDLLEQCIESVDHPAEIVVVNNNSTDARFGDALDEMGRQRHFSVLRQRRNLGVAGSWNFIVREGLSRGYDWFFVGSNDTVLHSGSLRRALDMEKEADVAIWELCGSNFFLLSVETVARVGWFDENFYPAYKEDQDYAYRCRLAGLRRVAVPGASADHVGSATIRSNPDFEILNRETHFNWNLNHYRMKWGGDAGEERFTHPYDDAAYDWRWWPDPGGSIEFRDWENIYRRNG